MALSIKYIRKEEHTTTAWSGGTTTQLAIYPVRAEYAKRNFKWRISSAGVEAEASEFTHLPGFWRYLMIIEGEMALEHEGHHSVVLKPYEQDSFSGEWTTHSKGRVTDFNLMLAEGCEGSIEAVTIKEVVQIELMRGNSMKGHQNCTEAFYCTEGFAAVTVNGEPYALQQGDLLGLDMKHPFENVDLCINCRDGENAVIIRATIYY